MPKSDIPRSVAFLPGLVHLAFFIRYALLVPAALVLLAFLGWQFRTNTILGNVFLVDGQHQMFHLTWLSLVAVALAMVEARVTLLNAKDRFPDCPDWDFDGPSFTFAWSAMWITLWLAIGLLIPLVCAWATPYGNTGSAPSLVEIVEHSGLAVLGGVGAAALLLIVASGTARFAIGHQLTAAELLPSDALFRRLVGTRVVAALDGVAAHLLKASTGYAEQVVDDTMHKDDPPIYRLRPGHAQLFFTLLLALVGYATVYFTVKPTNEMVPVLFYVILILIIAGVLLTAAAFCLDLYRLPVPIVLLTAGVLLSLASRNDHYFNMQRRGATSPEPPTLYDVVRQWQPGDDDQNPLALPRSKDGKRTLVVVAAAGGGIQATAWTAKVMTELHRRYGIPFTRSVRLVSGVSGGSVGLMYYLDRYAELTGATSPAATQATIDTINDSARASSLEATAWGIAFYDLVPTILPVRRVWPGLLRDRGSVLEDLWSSRLAHHDASNYTMRRTLHDVEKSGAPIPVFNSTNGSTGARFLWTPIRLIERDNGRICDPEELVQAYPNWDLSVVSAARLSATFSYVAPICRPVFDGEPYPRVPFADGGYAENEGILTVIQALTQLLSHFQTDDEDDQSPPFDRILIVRILPFAGAQPQPRTTYDAQDAALEDQVSSSAWRRALTGPLELLTQVRESSQSERGEWEAAQMQAMLIAEVRRWADRAGRRQAAQTDAADGEHTTMRRWLEPFAVTHNLVRRQKTGEVTPLGSVPESATPTDAHPLRERKHRYQPPLQIASVKFAFTLPGHAGVSHAAKLVFKPTTEEWDDYFTPLSWKMNGRQKQAIDAAWTRIAESHLGNLSPLDEPLFFTAGDEEPSLTLEDLFEHAAN
ncbi:MAG TPA: hypothetical protein VGN12_11565 [Pirellulales bacterium]|jgi:hypothetical protein